MTRRLDLRVNDEFAEQLRRLPKKPGRPMAAVLEAIQSPAIGEQ